MISFSVHGTPIPQGSTRAFIPKGWKRPIITAANTKTKPWKQEIAGAAIEALKEMGEGSPFPHEIAVRVEVWFYFAKPKSAPKRICHKTTKPDVDKLARAVLDGLTGIVFQDDSQVTQLWVNKFFDARPRADIRITKIERTEL